MTVQELLDQHRIPYQEYGQHHHTTPGFIQVDCPLCSPRSSRWRLGLSTDGRTANCWVCGRQKYTDILSILIDKPGYECWRLLKGIQPNQLKTEEPKRVGKLQLPSELGPLLSQHVKYLKKRQMDPDNLVKLWGLQGIGLAPRLGWRIFIPIFLGEEMVSWTTRSISDKVTKRYINAKTSQESVSPKKILFGEHYVRHCVIVTEGPFDAMRIGPGAVSLNGIGYSKAQMLRISKYPTRVVCFDNEPKAQQRAKELCYELESLPGETFNVTLNAKDPGSAPEAEIRQLRKTFLE